MATSVRVSTVVLPGRRIEFAAPELPPGTPVEVVVNVPPPPGPRGLLDFLEALPVGLHSYPTWEAAEQALAAERNSWEP